MEATTLFTPGPMGASRGRCSKERRINCNAWVKLPVKIVIFNNGTPGFVEVEMKAAGYVETGVALENPDFAEMAKPVGVHAIQVEDSGEPEMAARDVLAHDGLALRRRHQPQTSSRRHRSSRPRRKVSASRCCAP